MKERIYYSLLVKEPGCPWSPQFGDWEKEVVEQEFEDEKHNWGRGTRFLIIKTLSFQKDIDKKVEELNKKLGF